MHPGFSYIGLLFLLMLFVPNFLWMRRRPQGYDLHASGEPPFLRVLERIGQVLVTCLSLSFTDFNLHPFSAWSLWLICAFILLLLYEAYWISYFRSERTLRDFYKSFCGIPIAGAVLPVAGFFLLSVYGKNPLLAFSTLLLGVGHIGIHLWHRRTLCDV